MLGVACLVEGAHGGEGGAQHQQVLELGEAQLLELEEDGLPCQVQPAPIESSWSVLVSQCGARSEDDGDCRCDHMRFNARLRKEYMIRPASLTMLLGQPIGIIEGWKEDRSICAREVDEVQLQRVPTERRVRRLPHLRHDTTLIVRCWLMTRLS